MIVGTLGATVAVDGIATLDSEVEVTDSVTSLSSLVQEEDVDV